MQLRGHSWSQTGKELTNSLDSQAQIRYHVMLDVQNSMPAMYTDANGANVHTGGCALHSRVTRVQKPIEPTISS